MMFYLTQLGASACYQTFYRNVTNLHQWIKHLVSEVLPLCRRLLVCNDIIVDIFKASINNLNPNKNISFDHSDFSSTMFLE
jgi:hypothetical protein